MAWFWEGRGRYNAYDEKINEYIEMAYQQYQSGVTSGVQVVLPQGSYFISFPAMRQMRVDGSMRTRQVQRASAPPTTKEAEPEKTKGKEAEPKETGDKAEKTEEKTIKPFDPPPYQGLPPPPARGPRTPYFATPKDLQRAMSSQRLRQERATRPRPRSQSGNRKTAPRATLNLVLR
ncbi:unnamed protein product [Effrenium voratum]|uniref:WWE domain-containing protein n=1 Tax=Effrenium voratum TaxID=2562239 RepID=A0AA36I8S8_9DINO|nr:unnamed protein product [Effrenium voratum]